MTPYKWLTQQTAATRLWVLASVSAGFISGLLLVLQAYLLAHIINAAFFQHIPRHELLSPFVLILVVILMRSGLAWLRHYLGFQTSARVRRQLRKTLLDYFSATGPRGLANQSSGALASSVLEQVEAMHDFFAHYLPQMSLAVLIPVAILVVVFPLNWIAGTILLITAPLIPLFMALVGMGAKSVNEKQFKSLARMSAHFIDVLRGLVTLKLFNQSRKQAQVIGEVADEYRQRTMSVLRIAFLSSAVLEFFSSIAIALLATYLGLSFLGHIHFGYYHHGANFFAAFFILLLAPEFYLPLRELGIHYHARAQALGATEQIMEVLNTPLVQVQGGERAIPHSDAINLQLKGVSYAYPECEALSDVTLTIDAGQRLAVVGESGAGKSTLLHLIIGFIQPQSGIIEVNGESLHDLALVQWREQLTYLGQNPRLFHGTLRDNILMAKPDASQKALEDVLNRAHVTEFLEQLPQGLDTVLGEQNFGISGGQAQRIALARAFLKDASLILLDEPTANLDQHSEALVLEGIDALAKSKTLVLLTHRHQTLKSMDKIVVLEEGQIKEMGAYQSLMDARGALYQLLYSGVIDE